MKRFLVFAGSVYYPAGGIRDFRGDVSYLSKARVLAVKHFEPNSDGYVSDGWAHVYDTRTREIVAAWRCRGHGTQPADIEEVERGTYAWELEAGWSNE